MRKRKASRLSLLFHILWVLPVKENKIVFSSYEGDGGFCCNPRYIAEELHRRRPELEMVWLLHDTSKEFPSYIKKVKDTPFNTVYHLATSKVWIDNYRKPFGTLKRNSQLYIQTWHATIGFKAVGLFRGNAFPKIARLVSEWDSGLADYFLSNSQYCDDVYPKKLLYTGPTLRVGSPRVDPLVNNRDELYKSIREKLDIDKNCKLLLFAPTFRGGTQQGKKQVIAETPQIDFDRLIKALSEKYGCEWRVLLRLHPQLSAKLDKMPLLSEDDRLIDVSQWPDISEIMGGCDMVITDYSSCAFDAAFAHIPVLLYADDVQEYIKNRGQFMWKREELPFDIAEENETLIQNVEAFNEKKYEENISAFMNRYDVIEDGHASERVVDLILQN
ncbi:CDP-glycerol glycerophosphotransferase family protein [Butyrivibrio sp. AC2005]|uniref:CDP-glycerol glycerophosphotransferase family protein n=1 Tax=Butyrivibrio sp. AC2005 TaxID=1280672 RepID=UPI001FA6EE9B|nr:CDP-glycerol glycerophosphotransferase family protein [Butyrivibrio sp. AC2005]